MISDEASKHLGKELTSRHPLAVYGMALVSTTIGAGFEITSSTVTAVTANGCEIRVTLCKGDLCEMKKSFYAFQTPLNSEDEDNADRIASKAILPDVCAPRLFWLVTDPLALGILVVCGLLAYGTYVGVDGMTDALLKAPKLETTIGMVFGSSRNFSYAVCAAFWFSIVAHGIEACVAAYYAMSVLKIGLGPTSRWAFLVSLVGYPVLGRLQKLVAIERGHTKSK